jgi:thiol-disulfide isomerase/thioredoxin/YHS domain-containing protein
MSGRTVVLLAILALVIPLSEGMAAQTVSWEPTLEEAQRVAAQSNRLVMVQFWAPWCTHCRRMEAEAFTDASVAAELKADYVPIRVNADYFPATAKRYGVTGLPTTVILSPQGQLLDTIRGRMGAGQFASRLTRVAADAKGGTPVYAQIPPATIPPPGRRVAAAPVPPGPPQSPGSGPAPSIADTQPRDAVVTADHPAPTDSPQTPPRAVVSAGPSTGPPPPSMVPAEPAYGRDYPQPPAPPAGLPPTPAPPNAVYGPRDGQTDRVATGGPAPVGQASPPAAPSLRSVPNPSTQGGNPPLGLDGFCPVSLCEKQRWLPGDSRWGAIHRGRTYLFAGPDEQRRFFQDPDRYAPAVSGTDIVLAAEQGQAVPGTREHGVFYHDRIYLFTSEETLSRFAENPARYANQAIEAFRSGANPGGLVR